MKRAVFLYSLMFICMAANRILVIGSRAASGQTAAKSTASPEAKKSCPFSIIGMWKSDATAETNAALLEFSPDGWVTLLGYFENSLPQDFEMIAQVAYKLDAPAAPKRIEFRAERGNDVFPPGATSMEITEFSDNSFTTLDPATGEQKQWTREQTRRYFLTFAARSGPLPQGGCAFAMWTALDGRKTEVEALGIQLIKDEEGKTSPVFGPIPVELYNWVIEKSDKDKQRDKDENPFMRFELTAAEFETSRQIYLKWDKLVKDHALPQNDPYLNGVEFLKKAAESLNQCGEKVKLRPLTERERAEMISKRTLAQFLLEYISAMRKKNDDLHISNAEFPWNWRPMVAPARGQ